MDKENLKEEQEELIDSLRHLSPEMADYDATLTAIDRIDKILDRHETNREVEKLREENSRLREQLSTDGNVWWKDRQFIMDLIKVLLKVTAFLAAMHWEEVNTWTSRMYQNVKNLF